MPPGEFAAKAIEIKPDIVGLSGLITASFEMMKQTISALRIEAGKTQPLLSNLDRRGHDRRTGLSVRWSRLLVDRCHGGSAVVPEFISQSLTSFD